MMALRLVRSPWSFYAAGWRRCQSRARWQRFSRLISPRVESLCEEVSAETRADGRVLANDNCPGPGSCIRRKIGAVERLDRTRERRRRQKSGQDCRLALRRIRRLMAAALEGFLEVVHRTTFSHRRRYRFTAMCGREPLDSAAAIQRELDQQLTQSVRWTESMRAIIAAGAQTFIEIGSGSVLVGLMRRIDRSKARVSLNSVRALEAFLESLA